ncbi:phosphonate transport system permease protein [Paenibacillus phyllosphaerae]|uniref:Phosphonate transport system permease protein n=1 Tax=Paenibacillus phyllosphaerae TaxID=274593 RepID=A0A7W5B429_9BACL|nr:phosphonate ABC transporter, permease protein PhnE [Paenibacillus phyllosphaerae]MBB3113948.1 phosphonate transport system permease protein [Paenibacillus phyllosphaerae]
MYNQTAVPVHHRQKKAKRLMSLALLAAALAFSIIYVKFDLMEFLSGIPLFIRFIFADFLPPNMTNMNSYVRPVLDTLIFAVVGTFISSAIGLVIAFLMARNTSPHPVVRLVLRGIVSFVRNVPFLVWASLLVVIFGVGAMPGLFALLVFGICFLARVYAESIEELDKEATEALTASGASYGQLIRHAIIPQFMPGYYSWTLFMFEINIRASAILGLVGAGGIGSNLKQAMDLFQYGRASMIIVILIVLILAVEFLTQKIRERIL